MEAVINVKQLIMYILVVSLMGFAIGYVVGKDVQSSNTVTRAKSLGEKDVYSIQDMEIVIFGEIQE